MVHRIHYCFFYGRQRVVPETLCLGAIRVLDNGFFQVVTGNVVHRIAGNAPQRATKLFFLEAVTARAIGKIHHVNLGRRKKPLRMLVEE